MNVSRICTALRPMCYRMHRGDFAHFAWNLIPSTRWFGRVASVGSDDDRFVGLERAQLAHHHIYPALISSSQQSCSEGHRRPLKCLTQRSNARIQTSSRTHTCKHPSWQSPLPGRVSSTVEPLPSTGIRYLQEGPADTQVRTGSSASSSTASIGTNGRMPSSGLSRTTQ